MACANVRAYTYTLIRNFFKIMVVIFIGILFLDEAFLNIQIGRTNHSDEKKTHEKQKIQFVAI